MLDLIWICSEVAVALWHLSAFMCYTFQEEVLLVYVILCYSSIDF